MNPDLAQFLENNKVSGPRAYLLAAAGMSVATALRIALNPMLGDSAPYALHALVLLVVTSLGGIGPGLFALAVALTFGWTSLAPYEQPMGQQIATQITTAVAGSIICLVTATMRTSILDGARARREANFLSLEMHHRVKNLYAVVASMVTLSARDRPGARETLLELRARVQALAEAHDVTISEGERADLPGLINRIIAPFSNPESGESRVLVSGDLVALPPEYTTSMALIFHELATNAVKYGALGKLDGQVRLSWTSQDDMLDIRWQEYGAGKPQLPSPETTGFGTVLMQASVAQMRGKMTLAPADDGLDVRLSIPLTDRHGKRFRSDVAGDSQKSWHPSKSSLSALRASKDTFRVRHRIWNSRS